MPAGVALALLALTVGAGSQVGAAQATVASASLLAQAPSGHWQLVDTTTRSTFEEDWAPGSTWTPTFGGSSSGGTIVDREGQNAVRVTTNSSWSVSSREGAQVLYPGETISIQLTIETTATGLTDASNLASGDQVVASGFGTTIASASDEYKVYNTQTEYGRGTGSGSLVIPSGTPGERQTLRFVCRVNAGMGTAYTDWVYEWVESPTPSDTGSPPTTGTGPADVTEPTGGTEPTAGDDPAPAEPPSPGNQDLADGLTAAGIVSAAAALGLTLAGVGVLIASNRPKGGKTPPKKTTTEPPTYWYRVTLDRNSLELHPQEHVPLSAQAWRISSDGSSQPAPAEGFIQVHLPASSAGLAVSNSSGSGSVYCQFSVPTPTSCTTVPVTVTVSVGGAVQDSAQVLVRITPLYELELQWEQPQQTALQIEGKEARAWARVVATPPDDPDSRPDVLAGEIELSLQGPNSDWIAPRPLAPYIQFEKQWVAVSVVAPAAGAQLQPGNPQLLASFTRGNQQLQARLKVELNPEYVLGAWVNGTEQADVLFQAKGGSPGWDFADIITYFHAPDNDTRPIDPPGGTTLATPPITAVPDILDVKEWYPSPAQPTQYTIRVELRPGTNLETCFGAAPADQKIIEVTVRATDEKSRATVKYRLRPTLVFCVHSYETVPETPSGHKYRDIQLKELELAANGDDVLQLAGYFMKKEDYLTKGRSPGLRMIQESAEVTGFSWPDPQDDSDFELPELTADSPRDGFYLFGLKSKGLVEATEARLAATHTLTCKLALRSDVSGGYSLEAPESPVRIGPQFLRLRLWVVPGTFRHTSTAAAHLELRPSREPLGDQEVYLSVDSPAGMNLDPDGGAAARMTTKKAPRTAAGPGVALWTLRYSGITFENMPSAVFTVHAGLEDPPDAKWQAEQTINVYENLLALLNDLADDARLAEGLNNPNREDLVPVLELPPTPQGLHPWDTPENTLTNLVNLQKAMNYTRGWAYIVTGLPATVRENLYGPIYNIQSFFYVGPDVHVCWRMRHRIIDWLEKRRFKSGKESASAAIGRLKRMNGLDFGHYALVPAHVWAGIFPAGADRFAEYRALDPWWGQQWPDEWRRPENLLTQAGENARGAVFKALNYVLIWMCIRFRPTLTLYKAAEAVWAWLNGQPPERVQEIIGESRFEYWYGQLQCDSDNVDADGKYTVGVAAEKWIQELIKELD